MATAAAAKTETPAVETDAADLAESEEAEAETPASDDAANDAAAEAAAAAESDDGAEPAEGEEKPETEAKADDEKKPETPKALEELTVEELTAQLTEEQLRRVSQKFANKTMAAARKAERVTGEVRTQNAALTAQVTTYQQFVDQFQTNPMAALRRLPGWQAITFKDFAQKVVDTGSAAEPAKVDPQVAALQKRLDDKERAEQARNAEMNVKASQERVYASLEKEPERFDLVLTDIGKPQLWEAITAYYGKHGSCPDEKVFEMAELLEARLETSVSKSKKFARPSVKTGTSAAGKAPSPASGKGKTITNKASSAAPVTRTNRAETEDELDRRINAEMRAEGLI
jgi:hypothetical protein